MVAVFEEHSKAAHATFGHVQAEQATFQSRRGSARGDPGSCPDATPDGGALITIDDDNDDDDNAAAHADHPPSMPQEPAATRARKTSGSSDASGGGAAGGAADGAADAPGVSIGHGAGAPVLLHSELAQTCVTSQAKGPTSPLAAGASINNNDDAAPMEHPHNMQQKSPRQGRRVLPAVPGRVLPPVPVQQRDLRSKVGESGGLPAPAPAPAPASSRTRQYQKRKTKKASVNIVCGDGSFAMRIDTPHAGPQYARGSKRQRIDPTATHELLNRSGFQLAGTLSPALSTSSMVSSAGSTIGSVLARNFSQVPSRRFSGYSGYVKRPLTLLACTRSAHGQRTVSAV